MDVLIKAQWWLGKCAYFEEKVSIEVLKVDFLDKSDGFTSSSVKEQLLKPIIGG